MAKMVNGEIAGDDVGDQIGPDDDRVIVVSHTGIPSLTLGALRV